MKVLSIREPYASLIKKRIKYIETRSWKTSYRGDILIHSCNGKYPIKDKIKHLISNNELQYGRMLCIARLVDCIYIDDDYAQQVKKDNYENYLCGDYTVGRYAWVLSDIRDIKNSPKISGHLSLWNYDGDFQ